MIKLQTLLNKNKVVMFHIKEPFRMRFLEYAKKNGCVWINGDEILTHSNKCGLFMGINKSLHLGFIPYLCYFTERNKTNCITFNTKFIEGENYEIFND